jgi:hypothetical protein
MAHRFAYFSATFTWPGDSWVLHRCDNPPCCNPAHLFLGDAAAIVARGVDPDVETRLAVVAFLLRRGVIWDGAAGRG